MFVLSDLQSKTKKIFSSLSAKQRNVVTLYNREAANINRCFELLMHTEPSEAHAQQKTAAEK